MKRSLLLALLAGAAMACATPSSGSRASTAAEEEDQDVVCEYQKPTGSHFRKRVCRQRDLAEEEERQAEDFMRRGLMTPNVRN